MSADYAKLTRLLINAGAVPVPVDPMPSAMQQPLANDDDPVKSEIVVRPSDDRPTPDLHVGDNGHGHAAAETVADPLLASLQSAREAIHDSLRPGSPDHSGDPVASNMAPQDLSLAPGWTGQLPDTHVVSSSPGVASNLAIDHDQPVVIDCQIGTDSGRA